MQIRASEVAVSSGETHRLRQQLRKPFDEKGIDPMIAKEAKDLRESPEGSIRDNEFVRKYLLAK